MLIGFIEQEILEGKVCYFGLHTCLNDREAIDLQKDYEAVIYQQQSKQKQLQQKQSNQ